MHIFPPHKRRQYSSTSKWSGHQTNGFDLASYIDFLGTTSPNVIICGDFNDHRNGNFYRGLSPFSDHIFGPELSTIMVSSQNYMPPKSCCGTPRAGGKRNRQSEDEYYSDYILISQNMLYLRPNHVPVNFNYNGMQFPTSDHLPVTAIVSPITSAVSPVLSEIVNNTNLGMTTNQNRNQVDNRNFGNGINKINSNIKINNNNNNENQGMSANNMAIAMMKMRLKGGKKKKTNTTKSKSKLKSKLKTKKSKKSKKSKVTRK